MEGFVRQRLATLLLTSLWIGCTLAACPVNATDVCLDVDWAAFLARSDLVWTDITKASVWSQSGFVGNGNLGAMLFAETPQALRVDISRTDVYDTRVGHSKYSINNNFAFDRPRLPNGHFLINAAAGMDLNEAHPMGRRGGCECHTEG